MDGCWHDSCSTRHQSITHPRAGLITLFFLQAGILSYAILSCPVQANAFQAGLSLHPVKSVPIKDCSTVHPSMFAAVRAAYRKTPSLALPRLALPCFTSTYPALPCLFSFQVFLLSSSCFLSFALLAVYRI